MGTKREEDTERDTGAQRLGPIQIQRMDNKGNERRTEKEKEKRDLSPVKYKEYLGK